MAGSTIRPMSFCQGSDVDMLQPSAHPADLAIKEKGSTHATPLPFATSFRLHERHGSRPRRGRRRHDLRVFLSHTLVTFYLSRLLHLEDAWCLPNGVQGHLLHTVLFFRVLGSFFRLAFCLFGLRLFSVGVLGKEGDRQNGRAGYTELAPHPRREPRDTINFRPTFGAGALGIFRSTIPLCCT